MPLAVRIPLPVTATAIDEIAERPILEAFEDFAPLAFDLGFSDPGPFEEPPPPTDDPAERLAVEAVAEPEPEPPQLAFEPFAFDEIDDGIAVVQAFELAADEHDPGYAEAGPFEFVLNDLPEIVNLGPEIFEPALDDPGSFEATPLDFVFNDLPEIVALSTAPEDEPEQPAGLFEALFEVPPADDDIVLPPELVEQLAAEDDQGVFEPAPAEELPPPADDISGAPDAIEFAEAEFDAGSFESSPFEEPPPPEPFGIVPPGLVDYWRRLRRREEARRGKPERAEIESEPAAAEPAPQPETKKPRRIPPVDIDVDRRIERQLQAVRTLEQLQDLLRTARGVERRMLAELMQFWRAYELAALQRRDEEDAIAVLLMD